MKILIGLFVLVATTFNAFAEVRLALMQEKPFINCEVSQENVKITRLTQGIKFTKIVSYQIGDLSKMIKAAFESRNAESDKKSEHIAFYEEESEAGRFYLDIKEPNALKLINVISTLCEVRYL